MKCSILILLFFVLSLTSCNKNEEGDYSRFSKNIDQVKDPCELITKQMIVCHFGVSSSVLKIQEKNQYSQNNEIGCGFIWEKSISNDGRTLSMNKLDQRDFENHIMVGNFRSYENHASAKRDFKNTYWVSLNQDLKHDFEKNNASDNAVLKISYDEFGSGYQFDSNGEYRLTEVFGVGDQAFYDHLNKSLDVRFGTFSFSIFIETEYDTETNILIAKKLAREVWEKL